MIENKKPRCFSRACWQGLMGILARQLCCTRKWSSVENLCSFERNDGGQVWLDITVLIVFIIFVVSIVSIVSIALMSSRDQIPRIGR